MCIASAEFANCKDIFANFDYTPTMLASMKQFLKTLLADRHRVWQNTKHRHFSLPC